ncbi:hypothetical protein BU25DRAFT_2659 [Macroventuria anomochaeta]|uniref:Uncharacterized protein n=1 Tax=Macroventuria anomochaeta TaxID=301207 RepID=A0ACB6SH03_9PLEO|nr:uncharacterized protein BU25DRAFT_2659 [Macroventuria anomochaeta]KAF2633253.1 hypothetical protein BU25DRAFT_2659 [Macroventuria anomochaeta]
MVQTHNRNQPPSSAPYGINYGPPQHDTIIPETATFDPHVLNEPVYRRGTNLRGSTPKGQDAAQRDVSQPRGRTASKPIPVNNAELRDVTLSPPRIGGRFEEVDRPREEEPELIDAGGGDESDEDMSDSSDSDEDVYHDAKAAAGFSQGRVMKAAGMKWMRGIWRRDSLGVLRHVAESDEEEEEEADEDKGEEDTLRGRTHVCN